MSAKRAIVVGGGFAGLTAGYYLRKAGWEVVLLEAANRVGGRVGTVRRDGYTLDIGATQMGTGYKQYLALCEELGIRQKMIESCPNIGILRGHDIHVIDGRSALSGPLSGALSFGGKLQMLKTIKDYLGMKPPVEVLDVSASHAWDVESAEAYALRRMNREVADVLVDPLLRCYVMNVASEVSALEWFSTLRNLGGQTLLSMQGGNDTLPEALTKGVDLRLSSPVQAVRKTASGVSVSYRDPAGNAQELQADACVLAARLPETVEAYPEAREPARELLGLLKYNRAWVVQLGYRIQPKQDIVGLLISKKDNADVSLLWFEHNKNPDRAPAGHALFSVYSDEATNDVNYVKSDADLEKLGRNFVEGLFPELKTQHDMTHVTRWPRAIPNPSVGYYKAVHQLKQRLDPRDRVQLAGDYFTCVGQNSAIHYGRLAAENLIAAG